MNKMIFRTVVCLFLASAIWLPSMHLFFRPRADATEEMHALCDFQTAVWRTPEKLVREQDNMRRTNPEWDFMSRTYFALALANLALREPQNAGRYLATMDFIIDDTLKQEREHGKLFFLMDYAKKSNFVHKSQRSIFEDGEIALMLAARRIVREKEEYRAPLRERIDGMEKQMRDGPVMCAESYPDECWMFCSSVALAAMKCADFLDGSDHSGFFREWVSNAKENLLDKRTGVLISSFDLNGVVQDGPEGSSIWMVAHCLQLVDPEFAKQQYGLARKDLAHRVLGFGYASEWPKTFHGATDVDSGPVIPLLDASASSSGLAILGAAAFRDAEFLNSLRTSLNAGGFPHRNKDGLRYCAGNQVGDSVLLYALAQGPLWEKLSTVRMPR